MSAIWEFVVRTVTGKESHSLTDGSSSLASSDYTKSFKSYASYFQRSDGSENQDSKSRQKDSHSVTKHYYDLSTDFYEYGWGSSFHFAPRYAGESLAASIIRHEHYLAAKLGLSKDDKVLDAGCGIMGPARNIARFTGAHITGLNLNAYQVRRSNLINEKTLISSRLNCVEGNFAETEFPDNSFDYVYSIEAFCHAPDKGAVFREMFRVLKPGGLIAVYDWVMTDEFDENDEAQVSIKHFIEKGNGIATMQKAEDVVGAFKQSGFEMLECTDLAHPDVIAANGNDVPWYDNFVGRYRCSQQLLLTPLGRAGTQLACDIMDKFGIAPSGTSSMHKILSGTADALATAGAAGIFTPMLFLLARKPEEK